MKNVTKIDEYKLHTHVFEKTALSFVIIFNILCIIMDQENAKPECDPLPTIMTMNEKNKQ